MKIGLIDVDGNNKSKKWGAKPFPNLALAKLSRYHKQKGDQVKWYQRKVRKNFAKNRK